MTKAAHTLPKKPSRIRFPENPNKRSLLFYRNALTKRAKAKGWQVKGSPRYGLIFERRAINASQGVKAKPGIILAFNPLTGEVNFWTKHHSYAPVDGTPKWFLSRSKVVGPDGKPLRVPQAVVKYLVELGIVSKRK